MSDFIPSSRQSKDRRPGSAEAAIGARKSCPVKNGAKPLTGASLASFKAKDSFANTKKTTFHRKASK
jgi:hypothetical protein